MQIKAIETKYKGYRFRSRTEARWAILFDSLGIKWKYESEGYDLGNGIYYLPDFKINVIYPSFQTILWIEIKGEYPSKSEIKKLFLLSKTMHCVCFFFVGVPGDHSIYFCDPHKKEEECMEKIGMMKYQLGNILGFESEPFFVDSVEVSQAISAARAARFEFGGSP